MKVPSNIALPSGEILTIRTLSPSDSIDELTKLLNHSYAELLTMGFRFLATHQDSSITRDRLNGELSFVAEVNERIIGTVTLYNEAEYGDCEYYSKDGVWRFGQFGVEPTYQRSGIGSLLMDTIEYTAKDKGALALALDTAEGATHLIRWYESRGYTFVQHVQWDVTNYRSVVMSKEL